MKILVLFLSLSQVLCQDLAPPQPKSIGVKNLYYGHGVYYGVQPFYNYGYAGLPYNTPTLYNNVFLGTLVPQNLELLEHVFNELDIDQTNSLNLGEFLQGFSEVHPYYRYNFLGTVLPPNPVQLEYIFNQLDKDQNNSLTLEEFSRVGTNPNIPNFEYPTSLQTTRHNCHGFGNLYFYHECPPVSG